MAQVRKYDTGGETSPKLLKREGYGDYNVADIESQYAKNLNGILDEMGLEGEDRQKVIETTKNIMSNITNGTINTINSSGQWIVPKEYSSTGYNTYKNAGLFGIKGKKVVRDQNYYNNTAYYILDKVINGTNTYTAKKEDPKKEKVNPDQSFEQYLNKYYFNDDKATFDKKLWDYSTAKQGIIDRLKEYRDIISKSDMTDAAKTDYLSRIDSGISGLTDDITTNDYSSLARLGWNKPYMWLDENFDTPPETAEQKAVREAKEKIEAEVQAKQQALANQAAVTATTGSQYRPDLQSHYDPNTGYTYYGDIDNGVFYPTSRVNKDETVTETFNTPFEISGKVPFVSWQTASDKNVDPISILEELKGKDLTSEETQSIIERYQNIFDKFKASGKLTEQQMEAIKNIEYWLYEQLNKPVSNKSGGIIKAEKGTSLLERNRKRLKKTLSEYHDKEREPYKEAESQVKRSGDKEELPIETIEKRNNPIKFSWNDLSATEKARMTAIGLDLASAVSAYIPVYGTAISAVSGIGSSLTNFGTDLAEGTSLGNAAGNLAIGLGADLAGLIPGLGTSAKAAKTIKALKGLLTAGGAAATLFRTFEDGPELYDKIVSGKQLTAEDLRKAAYIIQSAAGFGRMGAGKIKSNKFKNKYGDTKTFLTTKSGKQVEVTKKQLESLKKAKGLEKQNEILAEIAPGEQLQTEFNDYKNFLSRTKSNIFKGKPDVTTESIFRENPFSYQKDGYAYSPRMFSDKGIYDRTRQVSTDIDISKWFPDLRKLIPENVGYSRTPISSNKQGGIIEKYRQGNIIKYQSPAQPMTHIQAKNMDKWNRNNALSEYNIAKDIEDYLNSGLDLDTYIAAFNGGEDIYDKMVGNTDYFNGKNVVYKETPLAKQRQVSFRSTNRGFDDLIRSAIIGHGTTEGKDSYDEALGDRTYNRTLGWINADQAKNFNNQINKFGIEFYLDPNSGHYRLQKIPNTSNVTTSQTTTNTNPITSVTNQNTDTGKGAYDTDKDKEIKTPYFDNLLAAGRLAGTLYTNNKVAKTVSESLKPMELTPHRIRRQVRGDLPTKTFYENQAAESNRLGSRPITSDANLQLAQQLMYNDRALKLKMQGFLADKEAIDKTSLLAQQANEQNQANAVDVTNKNRASMLGIQQAKANIEASKRSANWQQAWNPYLSSMEQKYINYSKQLSALNRDAANTAELRKLDAVSKQAQNTLDLARTNWLKANTGKSEYDWLNSDEYKNALNDYTEKVTTAGNVYKDTMSKYDLNNLRKPYSFLMFKSGGSTKDIAIENMKELNKTFRKNEELFHKIIMDSKKENNKLIMNLSSLTKELIIKSMTM